MTPLTLYNRTCCAVHETLSRVRHFTVTVYHSELEPKTRLEEHNRVVATNGTLQQSLRVCWGATRNQLHARNGLEVRLQALRVFRAELAAHTWSMRWISGLTSYPHTCYMRSSTHLPARG